MKALIGTEIIRFKQRAPKNETVKNLFYWLEKLKFDKVIYPDVEAELGMAHGYEILAVRKRHKTSLGKTTWNKSLRQSRKKGGFSWVKN